MKGATDVRQPMRPTMRQRIAEWEWAFQAQSWQSVVLGLVAGGVLGALGITLLVSNGHLGTGAPSSNTSGAVATTPPWVVVATAQGRVDAAPDAAPTLTTPFTVTGAGHWRVVIIQTCSTDAPNLSSGSLVVTVLRVITGTVGTVGTASAPPALIPEGTMLLEGMCSLRLTQGIAVISEQGVGTYRLQIGATGPWSLTVTVAPNSH